MRPAAATYVGTTDHSSPQRVQVKYSNSHVIAVTIGGPCEWQRGHVPNGAGLGFKFSVGDMELTPGPSARCNVGVVTSLADPRPRWCHRRDTRDIRRATRVSDPIQTVSGHRHLHVACWLGAATFSRDLSRRCARSPTLAPSVEVAD